MQEPNLQDAGPALEISDEICSLTKGASMRPMLREHRDVVTVKQVDRELKKGDVVLYPGKNGSFVLHRIIAVKNGEYIIRGDNNYFKEKDITKDKIVGVLKEFYRDGKYINCETSRGYKWYTFYILHSYPIRFIWVEIICRAINKIKRIILKKKKR